MDARFIHEQLSALNGVGTISAMLETVVSEKYVLRRSPFDNGKISAMLGKDTNGTKQDVASLGEELQKPGWTLTAGTPSEGHTPEILSDSAIAEKA